MLMFWGKREPLLSALLLLSTYAELRMPHALQRDMSTSTKYTADSYMKVKLAR